MLLGLCFEVDYWDAGRAATSRRRNTRCFWLGFGHQYIGLTMPMLCTDCALTALQRESSQHLTGDAGLGPGPACSDYVGKRQLLYQPGPATPALGLTGTDTGTRRHVETSVPSRAARGSGRGLATHSPLASAPARWWHGVGLLCARAGHGQTEGSRGTQQGTRHGGHTAWRAHSVEGTQHGGHLTGQRSTHPPFPRWLFFFF